MKKIRVNGELSLLLALAIIALSIALVIKADFGMTVVQAPVYVLSLALPFVSIGVWNYIVQGLIMVLMIAIAKRVKVSYLLSFAAAVIYGLMLDFVNWLLAGVTAQFLWQRILFFGAGYILLCIAVAIFFTCKAPLMPYDIFVREVAAYKKITIPKLKWIFDIACITTAVVISLAITHKIKGVGIGTVIFAFTVSPVSSLIMKFLNARFEFKPFFRDKEYVLKTKRK